MEELLKELSANHELADAYTTEQVAEAKAALKDFMAGVKAGEITAAADDLAEVKALSERLTARETVLAEEQEAFDAQLAEIEAALGIEEEAPEVEETVEVAEEAPEAEEATEVVEEVKEPVMASVEMGRVAKRVPAERKPQPQGPALIASAELNNERIENAHRLGELMLERHRQLGNGTPGQGQTTHKVASFGYQSEHVINDPKSAEAGQKVIEALQKQARKDATVQPESLTAALAFCAPAQPVYEQYGNVTRDGLLALPTVTAPRGQITYPDSISYQSLTGHDGLGEPGIGTNWTGTGNKSVFTMECPTDTTCSVEAYVTILQINNATGRFYPEAVADLTAKAMATAAQVTNIQLIADLVANSKVNTVQGEVTNLGGIGSIANNIAYHAAEYREKYRISKGAILDAVFPHWVFDALFVDAFARDATVEYSGVRARLAGMLSDLNIRPQFVYGWQDIAPDLFGTFPATADIMLWEPGTVVRLDSGTLDLGVVRDSTLNATNDYQTFAETFEAVCVPGHEVLLINDVPVCPSGATGARVTVNCSATPS